MSLGLNNNENIKSGPKDDPTSAQPDILNLSAPKRPKPYQLAAQIERAALNCTKITEEDDKISLVDLAVIRQLGLPGLLLSIVSGSRMPPSTFTRNSIAEFRATVEGNDKLNPSKSSLTIAFGAWLHQFGIGKVEARNAVRDLGAYLKSQAISRRELLPRLPFDWNDVVAFCSKNVFIPIALREAAFTLSAHSPSLQQAIEIDPFRTLMALRKLFAPPQQNCEAAKYQKWLEAFEKGQASQLRSQILPIAESALSTIARDETAIGLRILALEGNDEKLKRRAGTELSIIAKMLPRQCINTLALVNCDELFNPNNVDTLDAMCKSSLMPENASLFLGRPNYRYSVDEAEVEVLTGKCLTMGISNEILYHSNGVSGMSESFSSVALKIPIAVATAIERRLESVDINTSPTLHGILSKTLNDVVKIVRKQQG